MKFCASMFLAVVTLLTLSPRHLCAEEPAWREPWQKGLTAWLQSLVETDVTVGEKTFDWSHFDPEELHRTSHLATGAYSPYWIAATALRIPDKDFLWKGGLWREDGSPQDVLKPYGIKTGQMWIPTVPTIADSLAWLYTWDRPWNPYKGDRAVALRAAVISMVDLIMLRENLHYYTSGEEGCYQPPFGVRACDSGFLLTYNAYCFLQVADALPQQTRKDWADGIRWYAEYNLQAPPGGPENMRLSVPVGIYYAGMALGDESYKQAAVKLMDRMIAEYFRRPGYLADAGIPDGSYNGISLHRLAEFWAISGSRNVLETMRKSYDLKAYLTLPEPDGSTLSPSHFNARCKDGFDNDQYQGREAIILEEVPTAGLFLKKTWLSAQDEQDMIQHLTNVIRNDNLFVKKPYLWNLDYRWDAVLALPYVLYQPRDEQSMDAIIHKNLESPVEKEDRYTKNFGDEFYVVRRPGYAAIFYAGPAVPYDNGATNLFKMLGEEGGYMMGFGGGGLSAFWTPQSGSLLLGRMTACEGYERKSKVVDGMDYLISGWQDWLTNQIVGETKEGKILTSARTQSPRSRLAKDGSKLEIRGKIPRQSKRQGDILEAELSYQRTYLFDDQGIDCALEIQTDKPLELRSLFETLPILVGQKNLDRNADAVSGPTDWQFLGTDGKPIEPADNRVENVRKISLSRFNGGGMILFEAPVTISLTSVEATSVQLSLTHGRTLLINLPTTLEPGKPVQLKYRLVAGTDDLKTAGLPSFGSTSLFMP